MPIVMVNWNTGHILKVCTENGIDIWDECIGYVIGAVDRVSGKWALILNRHQYQEDDNS